MSASSHWLCSSAFSLEPQNMPHHFSNLQVSIFIISKVLLPSIHAVQSTPQNPVDWFILPRLKCEPKLRGYQGRQSHTRIKRVCNGTWPKSAGREKRKKCQELAVLLVYWHICVTGRGNKTMCYEMSCVRATLFLKLCCRHETCNL